MKGKILSYLKNPLGYFHFLVIVLVFIFVTYPFFHDGFFPGTDDVQVVRIDVMKQELLSGQFPVRYIHSFGNNNGGYMLFNFYPPLVYYIGVIFSLVGFTLVQSVKLVFLTGFLIGTVGIFTLLRGYTDKFSATVGTLLFLSSSYLGFDVYFRGTLPEVFAMMLLPWVLLVFLKLKFDKKPQTIWAVWGGLVFGLFIISHGITAFAVSLLLSLLLLWPPYGKRNSSLFVAALLIGVLISSFFWLPLIFEQHLTIYKSTYFVTDAYKGNFLNPLQLAGLQKIPWDFEPPLVGSGLFFGALTSIIFLIKAKNRNKKWHIGTFAAVGFVLSVFLTWDITRPLWERVAYLRFMQFPYRFLTIASVLAVILSAVGLSYFNSKKIKTLLAVLLLFPGFVLQYSYLRPETYNYISVYKAEDECTTTTWAQELLPLWVKKCLPKNNMYPLIQLTRKNDGKIIDLREQSHGRRVDLLYEGKENIIIFKKYFFPGWTGFIDGKKIDSFPIGKHGLVAFDIPEGKHAIRLELQNTWPRSMGNIISLISIIGVLLTCAYYTRDFLLIRKTSKKYSKK